MLPREAAPKLDDHADMWIRSHKQHDCHLSLPRENDLTFSLVITDSCSNLGGSTYTADCLNTCSVYSLQNTLRTEYKAHTMSNCRLSTLQTGLYKLIKIQKRLKERLLLPSSQEYSLEDA